MFDLRIDFFRQSDDRVITAFTVQTNNKELTFEQVGGLEQATMNIFGRITAVSGKRSGIFEDSVTTTATTDRACPNCETENRSIRKRSR